MAVGVSQRVGAYVKRLRAALELLERGRNILGAPDFKPVDFEAERVRHGQNLVASPPPARHRSALPSTANLRNPGMSSRSISSRLRGQYRSIGSTGR